MTAQEIRQAIQHLLHVAEDGVFGPKTMDALSALSHSTAEEWPTQAPAEGAHEVKATSFADPADVRAFQRCKDQGRSDQSCFAVGDNGVGKWGDDCKAGSGPSCALPPEFWSQFGAAARGKLVHITHGEKSIVAALRDTMPHLANITNGAGIDLNPDACEALGISVPAEARVTWQWA